MCRARVYRYGVHKVLVVKCLNVLNNVRYPGTSTS